MHKLAAAVIALCFVTGCAPMSSQPSGPSGPRVATPRPATASSVSVVLSAEDAAAIRAYYANQPRGNGKGRNSGLPPGVAKNLARGKPLPPGIAKQHLPPDLLVLLPPAQRGFEYVVVAGKLLLVEIATQIVHDILLDAVFG